MSDPLARTVPGGDQGPVPDLAEDAAERLARDPLHRALSLDPTAASSITAARALHPVYADRMAALGIGAPSTDYLWGILTPIARLVARSPQPGTRPRLVGLAGGPGVGKTTLSHLLAGCLPLICGSQTRCLSLSLDDFYLDRPTRERLGFAWRTLPGTHDRTRLERFVTELDTGADPMSVPRYDLGRDRPLPDEDLSAAPDICIFDGAMVGSHEPGYEALAARLDLLIFLDAPIALLRSWRFSREQRLRDRSGGTAGFSEDAMDRFWTEALEPSIHAWVRPNMAHADLVIALDADRRVRTARWQEAARAIRQALPSRQSLPSRLAHTSRQGLSSSQAPPSGKAPPSRKDSPA